MTENNTPLHTMPDTPEQGSLERGIRGEYDFSFSAVLSEAWARTHGSKWTFQLALTFYFLIYIALTLLLVWLLPDAANSDHAGFFEALKSADQNPIRGIITKFATLPLDIGLLFLGVRRATDAPISARMIFGYYNKIWPLILMLVLSYLCILLGFLLLIIPGIYLSFAYMFANYLLIDKKLSPWQALESSRKAVTRHWFKIVGFTLVMSLILIVTTVLTLGIALIWTLPLSYISMGILYRIIFGYEEEPPAEVGDPLVAQPF